MELIKRVFSACLITLVLALLFVIGVGGLFLDLLGAAASALIGVTMIAAACAWMEADDDE